MNFGEWPREAGHQFAKGPSRGGGADMSESAGITKELAKGKFTEEMLAKMRALIGTELSAATVQLALITVARRSSECAANPSVGALELMKDNASLASNGSANR